MSGQHEADDQSPCGSNRDGYTTQRITDRGLAYDVRQHARQVWRSANPSDSMADFQANWDRMEVALGSEPPELTVHECWSGYSEYTITNTWSEVSYRLGEVEQHFPGVAAFIAAIADAAERIEQDQQLALMQKLFNGEMP